MLAKNNKKYDLTAIDLSEKCLEIARSKAASADVSSQVNSACVDLLRDNWNVEPFDLIISTCSLHHWRRPVSILAQAQQLMADNGEIWILDDFADVSSEDRANWIKKVEDTCKPGWLFRTVFSFESKFLAYSHSEIADLCKKAGFSLSDFSARDVFFVAILKINNSFTD